MNVPDSTIRADLTRFLDEEEPAALDRACTLAAAQPVDIAALLSWVQNFRCDPALKAQALRSLRAALRLAVIPGAVCRPEPPQ